MEAMSQPDATGDLPPLDARQKLTALSVGFGLATVALSASTSAFGYVGLTPATRHRPDAQLLLRFTNLTQILVFTAVVVGGSVTVAVGTAGVLRGLGTALHAIA